MERLVTKQARQKNHLCFNLRCRDEEITPASLNIKNPIQTKNAERMMKKIRMALVKERVRITTNKLNTLESEINRKTGLQTPVHKQQGNGGNGGQTFAQTS